MSFSLLVKCPGHPRGEEPREIRPGGHKKLFGASSWATRPALIRQRVSVRDSDGGEPSQVRPDLCPDCMLVGPSGGLFPLMQRRFRSGPSGPFVSCPIPETSGPLLSRRDENIQESFQVGGFPVKDLKQLSDPTAILLSGSSPPQTAGVQTA